MINLTKLYLFQTDNDHPYHLRAASGMTVVMADVSTIERLIISVVDFEISINNRARYEVSQSFGGRVDGVEIGGGALYFKHTFMADLPVFSIDLQPLWGRYYSAVFEFENGDKKLVLANLIAKDLGLDNRVVQGVTFESAKEPSPLFDVNKLEISNVQKTINGDEIINNFKTNILTTETGDALSPANDTIIKV